MDPRHGGTLPVPQAVAKRSVSLYKPIRKPQGNSEWIVEPNLDVLQLGDIVFDSGTKKNFNPHGYSVLNGTDPTTWNIAEKPILGFSMQTTSHWQMQGLHEIQFSGAANTYNFTDKVIREHDWLFVKFPDTARKNIKRLEKWARAYLSPEAYTKNDQDLIVLIEKNKMKLRWPQMNDADVINAATAIAYEKTKPIAKALNTAKPGEILQINILNLP